MGRADSSTLRFAAPDAALALFLILHSVAAMAAMRDEAAGPAVNMLWEWIGIGVAYFLFRQLVNPGREARALIAVSIALAVSLSVLAFEQYFISMPAAREFYYQDPDAALRQIGMWSPPGSRERMLYEERLESSEPTATFALANSLAGYLTPWLVLLGGIAIASFANRGSSPRVKLTLLLLAVPIVACLLLTKSRTAYVAVAFGLLLGWILMPRVRATIGWKLPVAIAVALVVLIVIGVVAGGLDWEVLSEAPKSLAYRTQYWQGAAAIARDDPWLGCGPGNFGDHYTQYKAPTASEEVTDPHNFVLEVWATAGTPAALALLAVLATFAWITCRELFGKSRTAKEGIAEHDPAPPTEREHANAESNNSGQSLSADLNKAKRAGSMTPPTADAGVFIIAGGLGGFPLAAVLPLVVGPLIEIPLTEITFAGGFIAAAVSTALTYPWIRDGSLPLAVVVAAAAALVVNLLGAGGIGFPGVALSLWLLIAVGVTMGDEDRPMRSISRGVMGAMTVALFAMLIACYWGAYRPVALRETHLAMAQNEPSRAVDHLHSAARADRRSEEPWNRLAHVYFDRWQRLRNQKDLDAMNQAIGEMVDLRPRSSRIRLEAGDLFVNVEYRLRTDGDAQGAAYLERAIDAYERAVELYPNRALGQAKLALAHSAAGNDRAAREAAAAALELDRVTPHRDLKLDPELRKELLRRTKRPN